MEPLQLLLLQLQPQIMDQMLQRAFELQHSSDDDDDAGVGDVCCASGFVELVRMQASYGDAGRFAGVGDLRQSLLVLLRLFDECVVGARIGASDFGDLTRQLQLPLTDYDDDDDDCCDDGGGVANCLVADARLFGAD